MGKNALAAINPGLPILCYYMGVGLYVGGTVICGRLLGARDNNKADKVFSQMVVTARVICILTSITVLRKSETSCCTLRIMRKHMASIRQVSR